ncbi:carbohydrate porin [Roseomonas sp. CCTCC AB2023176]|uniref:carbohydrate porin n=1 Tax=Roseomonas sp. CCTCC AB2023176 TaxID=3342640 RepID=UPI0035D7697B
MRTGLAALAAAALALPTFAPGTFAQPASVQPGPASPPAEEARTETSDQAAAQDAEREPSVAPLLGPVGNLFGLRDAAEARGLEFSVTYIGEVLRNASGGARRGSAYEGRVDLQADLDLGRAVGWEGAKIHANLFAIHGRGLSRGYAGNILTISGIEALPSTRLYELWFEQSFRGGSIRIGQLAADTEFQVSEYGALFVNSTFGWPASSGANLPSGGPAYPLATPGVRLRLDPAEGWTILAGAFNGDPAGAGEEDPQRRNRDGLRFRLRDEPFVIAEAQYAYGRGGLAGRVNLGAWYHFGRFPDPRFTQDGLSLADPEAGGSARLRRGNHGLYAGVDQAVWRGEGDARVGVFARAGASPGDRNLVSLYADGGIVAKGLVPGRPDDTFGLAAAYARLGGATRGLDRDARLFGTPDAPVRSSEVLIEATYQASVVPGWTVQPVLQRVIRPGGGAMAARAEGDPPRRARDATVIGLRTAIRF